ncbi:MAG: hypothetical protein RII27_03955, partial [Alphaproteobacteria bacterium]
MTKFAPLPGFGRRAGTTTGIERRLSLRLLSHWRDLKGDGEFPNPAMIVADGLGDMWPHAFIMEIDAGGGEPVFTHAGPDIDASVPGGLAGRPLSAAPPTTLIGQAIVGWENVVRRRVPVSLGGDMEAEGGVIWLFRSILLPLSDDSADTGDAAVTHVLGAVNG